MCEIYFSRWADTSEAVMATSAWASWQSVSQALKAKGQRYQSEIGKRDVMEQQPGPAGNGELSWSCLLLLVTSLNRSVPCVQHQPVYTANTWHTLNPRQLSTALNSEDSSFIQWRLLQRNGLFTQNSQEDVVFPKTL